MLNKHNFADLKTNKQKSTSMDKVCSLLKNCKLFYVIETTQLCVCEFVWCECVWCECVCVCVCV